MDYSCLRCGVVPNILGNLFIRVRRTQWTPRGDDESFPGICGDEPFYEFESIYNRLDVEISSQETQVNNRRVEWIRGFQCDTST